MHAESIRFDDVGRVSTSDQPVPPGGVLRALRNAADMCGLDPAAELYNEALRYASEGHLRLARERLQVLLGIAPDDGEARLLLAKVHVAGQRWQEALAALDEAQACGEHVPMELRDAVEEHLRADLAAEEEEDVALRAREQGEIKALRQEARRLRSENAMLVGRCSDLEKETRKWAWTTTAVSAIGLLFIAGNLLFGGGSNSAEVVSVEPAPADEVTLADAVAPTGAVPATPSAIADQAKTALQTASGLDETALQVVVRGNAAVVSGEVLTSKQRSRAEQVLRGVKGIGSVDASGVKVLARTKGTTHVVRKGDTLSKIALEYYGESSLADRLLAANGAVLKGRTDLSIGQELRVPAVD